jgi:glycosyltransferase involved in cell wall biosynthesis
VSAHSPDLVAVVVPVYNGAETINETLLSVRAQTHHALEIIVVDDGSTDDTAAILRQHQNQDCRVRVLHQRNAGVAAARNRAILESTADYIAPIDADDLWRPDKVAKQLQAMRMGGPQVGMCFTWTAAIDAESNIIGVSRPFPTGDALVGMCKGNVVGNGSAVMIPRPILLNLGGYDPSLRARNAQGCEDWKLYLQIAEHYEIVLIPEILTGYRERSNSMSADICQMMRSYELVAAEFAGRRPEMRQYIDQGEASMARWLFNRSLMTMGFREAVYPIRVMYRHSPSNTVSSLTKDVSDLVLRESKTLVKQIAGRLFRYDKPKRPPFLLSGLGEITSKLSK